MFAILAGGRSRRMGRDKGGWGVQGEPLLVRTTRLALATGAGAAVIGREPPDWWPEEIDVEFVPDDTPGLGPAGGLLSGLRRFASPIILVACDMPLIDRETLGWLAENLPASAGRDGTALMNGSQPEPLLSLYTPHVLPLLEARVAAGRRSLWGLHEEGDFRGLPIPEEMAGRIVGANTPEEMERLLRSRADPE